MAWARFDDNQLDNPDFLALGRDNRLVFVEATVWSCRHLTDGRIPSHALRRLTDAEDVQAAASALVEAGFWEPTEDGWQIVGFLDVQPSAEDVGKRREADKRRKQRERERNKRHRDGDHSMCTSWCPSRRDADSDERRESNSPIPTHPIPTEGKGRDGEGESWTDTGDAGAPPGPPQLPEGFMPAVHVEGGDDL